MYMGLYMKKLIVLCAIFVAINNFCFAEEGKTVKPKSKLGLAAGAGVQIPEGSAGLGIGGSIFCHYAFSRNWFLSLNAGYYRYNVPYTGYNVPVKIQQTDIPFTVGMNMFLDKKFNSYLGLEVGLINQSISASALRYDIAPEQLYQQSKMLN